MTGADRATRVDRKGDRNAPARGQRGQASVELAGILPALVLAVLIAAQLGVAGYALWSAGNAARAGARAVHVGADPAVVALRALPTHLHEGARVSGGPAVSVRVRVPRLLPFLPPFTVRARTSLGAEQ